VTVGGRLEATAQPETPFDQLKPNSITIPELGTGAKAIRLLQEAQLH
jgi:hypothetical protein